MSSPRLEAESGFLNRRALSHAPQSHFLTSNRAFDTGKVNVKPPGFKQGMQIGKQCANYFQLSVFFYTTTCIGPIES
jgi:hypothetical protein